MGRTTAGVASQHSFAMAPVEKVPRSVFDLRRRRTTTMDAGILYPLARFDCLPGETYNARFTAFVRFMSLKFPVMADFKFKWEAFFTPYRILWENWVRLQGERTNPDDSVDYITPWLYTQEEPTYTFGSLSLGDYFGLPVEKAIDPDDYKISALYFRAYNRIWNEWYRDQNYQDSVFSPVDDGPDDILEYSLLRRAKAHDYFTSVLPAPQKGPAVLIPWDNDGQAPVWGDGEPVNWHGYPDDEIRQFNWNISTNQVTTANAVSSTNVVGLVTPTDVSPGSSSHMYADVGLISATLNQFRTSIALQQVYELDARTGTRYSESLPARWSVKPQDARLQRPEYIGGGTNPISISSVPQTSPSIEGAPQAQLAAYGTSVGSGQIHYSTQEHGCILILGSITTPPVYQDHIHRDWLRSTRFDYAEPLLAHLGEQAVMTSEIYYDPSIGPSNAVWGYQERYAEYRYGESDVTGLMRSDVAGSLDAWNQALDFDSIPAMGPTFLEDNPPVDRSIAVPSQPQFNVDCVVSGSKVSPLPVYGTPGLRHF